MTKIVVPVIPLHEAEVKFFVFHLKRITEEQLWNVHNACEKMGLLHKLEFVKREIAMRLIKDTGQISDYDANMFRATYKQEKNGLYTNN